MHLCTRSLNVFSLGEADSYSWSEKILLRKFPEFKLAGDMRVLPRLAQVTSQERWIEENKTQRQDKSTQTTDAWSVPGPALTCSNYRLPFMTSVIEEHMKFENGGNTQRLWEERMTCYSRQHKVRRGAELVKGLRDFAHLLAGQGGWCIASISFRKVPTSAPSSCQSIQLLPRVLMRLRTRLSCSSLTTRQTRAKKKKLKRKTIRGMGALLRSLQLARLCFGRSREVIRKTRAV